jgi:hypothetical protein
MHRPEPRGDQQPQACMQARLFWESMEEGAANFARNNPVIALVMTVAAAVLFLAQILPQFFATVVICVPLAALVYLFGRAMCQAPQEFAQACAIQMRTGQARIRGEGQPLGSREPATASRARSSSSRDDFGPSSSASASASSHRHSHSHGSRLSSSQPYEVVDDDNSFDDNSFRLGSSRLYGDSFAHDSKTRGRDPFES